jgi:Ca2+/Na+ antiporter
MAEEYVRSDASRAIGRSWGALFFSFFGGCWFALAALAFHRANPVSLGLIGVCAAMLVATSLRMQSSAKKLPDSAIKSPRENRDDRYFGVLNAVQWVLVFLIFTLFPKLGLTDMIFPAILLIVGLHFFFMPASYRHTSTLVLGSVLVLWAILCTVLFTGDTRIGFVGLGAGVVLWSSAAFWLFTSSQSLKKVLA